MQTKLSNNTPSNTVVIGIGGEKFKFISGSEDQPILVILNTDKLYSVTFPVNYPLFSVILHLKKIYEDDEVFSHPDEIDTVIDSWTNRLDNLLDEALLNFAKNENGKIIIKKEQEAKSFINALEVIRELVNAIATKFPQRIQQLTQNSLNPSQELYNKFRHQIIEKFILKYPASILNFVLNFEKTLAIKSKERKLTEAISDFIVDQSGALIAGCLSLAYFHQANIYLKKALTFLEKLKIQERIHQQSFGLKVLSAQIYFEFGYFESALNLIRESQELFNKKYLPEFNDIVILLVNFLKNKLLPFYQNTNTLIALEVCQDTLSLLNNIFIQASITKQKDSIIVQDTIKTHHQAIKTIFSQTQEKYLAELTVVMKNSSAIKKMISKIQHNFDQHFLLLTPKTEEYKLALLNALRTLGVQSITPAAGQIKVDLYCCNPKLLAKACEKSLATLEEEANLAKLKMEEAEAKLRLTQAESTNLAKPSSAPTAVANTTNTTLSVEKEPITIPRQKPKQNRKKPLASTKNIEKPPVEVANQDKLAEKPAITYHWPKTGLTYHSKEGNQGIVKMLTADDNSIPDGVYFAYMPDYIFDDEHYHPGFSDRLTRGKLHKTCIRWITNEMQSLRKSELFLFKVVISRRDPRMYLYIEEIYTDEEGKQHFLLCAGFISNHKLKNLPNNPQKLKDKMLQKHHKMKAITQQAPNEDMAKKFFNLFIEIIYDENIEIPEQIKTSLQEFLKDFTNSAYLAKKELDSTQITILFSQLLEMNALLQKLGNQTENLTAQLAIVQEILQLLSALESQKIYWYIITPLLNIMNEAEAYYIREIKSSATNDPENFVDDEAAEQLLAQLTEASVQTETAVNNFEKIEPSETSTEKENAASNILTPSKNIT